MKSLKLYILPLAFAMGLIGCGGGDVPRKNDYVRGCHEDFDNDGITDTSCSDGTVVDKCPFIQGSLQDDGCPVVKIGEPCVSAGWYARDMLENTTVYPDGFIPDAFCMFNPEWYLKQVDPWYFTGSYYDRGVHGTWTQVDKDKPLYAVVSGPHPNRDGSGYFSRDPMKWALKDGTTGQLYTFVEGYLFRRSLTVLPQDGTLDRLEFDSNEYSIELVFPVGKNRTCTDKNASGGPLCRF